ncbi:phage tail assembly chaperone [Photobacterium sp. 1_MG-2023]|uniref:phage tail assembly chaperone n=1 Tax=Photobacterium sp. 1_MG-2023 TaxID=3062646 RepID=UPI0026E1E7E0|nr:phage tail assembly chaperone [Photobacterium sp. 1_MG-2023]MDO6707913.1 hypothetical protein [Photobacterium sp. 1_MG-2023]
MKKLDFIFVARDGNEHETIEDFSDDPEYYEYLKTAKASFYKGNEERERFWRNREYEATDYMLLPDATFNKIPLAGSTYLEDIKSYRQALRDYNLLDEPRPERPEWFKAA